jgi:predicted amidophosphoribosyltransferase
MYFVLALVVGYGIMGNMKRPLTHEDMMVRAIMDPYQQICRGCDQVITLSKPDPAIEYCLRCTEEINAWHDSHSITPEELEAWADLWALKENE